MAKIRPIIREVYNSDDRAARELAVHEFHKFGGPNAYQGDSVPVSSISGIKIKGSPVSGSINPPNNGKFR